MIRRLLLLAPLSWTLVGCDAPSAPAEAEVPVSATQSATAQGSATPPDGPGAHAELAKLDSRRPVPLMPMMAWHQKQNMMEHLVAIQRITAGLAHDDWDEIDKASKLIGTSPKMKMMCEHMGAGAKGFTEQALEFHRRADGIALAAKKQDKTAVLKATSETLKACTGCHSAFRQDVVSAGDWKRRTSSTPDFKHH